MKYYIKSVILILLTGMLFISCNEDETTYKAQSYPGNAFVFLDDVTSTLEVTEANQEDNIVIKARLANSLDAHTTKVAVDFNIVTTAKKGVDYEIVGDKTQFVFKPGVFEDVLIIKPIDNFEEDGDKEFTVKITKTNADVNVGFVGSNDAASTEALIRDDDCILYGEHFSGTPTGTEETSTDLGVQPSLATFTVVEEVSENVVKFKIENILAPQFKKWGEKITKGGEYFITIDNTNTLEPKVIPVDNGDPLGNNLAYFYAETDGVWGYYLKLEKFKLLSCSKVLELYFSVDIFDSKEGKVYNDGIKTVLKLEFAK